MRFCFRHTFLLSLLLFSQQSHAAESVLPASSATAASVAADKTVYIEAQQVEGGKNEQMEAHGKVELQQGNQKVFADHVIYKQETSDLTADGSVRMEQANETVSGPNLKMNTNSHIGEMTTPVFELKQNNAHGSASLMRSTGPAYYVFDHATYTTCPAGNDDWLLHMSRLDMDRVSQIGTARNAWVEFEGVPFLYTPWMTFPLDGARHSGVLAPIYANTSIGGAENTIPFYWNIAPNYDLTVSDRNMSKRGTMLLNEFRFLEPSSAGIIHYDEINNDHVTNTSRFHATLMETHSWGNGFRSSINLNRVSDDNYFRDLSVALADVAQTQLVNEGVVTYGAAGLSASVRAQSFQTLQDQLGNVAIPYQRLPQINLGYQKTIVNSSINMINEYVDFRHPTLAEGQRMVLYPSVTYALLNDPGFYIKPKFGINYTQYDMGNNNTTNIPNTTRTLPIFSLDSGMTLERDMNLGQHEFVQTLEPRIYYVKIPYQNQDFLPVYDTSQAGLSFPQMFLENRFYGNDRIGDADMVTAGLTSRIFDNEGGIERLNFGLAERYNFTMPQVNLLTPNPSPKSDILLSIGGKITNTLTLNSLFDYNPNDKYTTSGAINASYKPETGKLLNVGYHFTQNIFTPVNDVRQADLSTQWPLIWHWFAVSRLSYSLAQHLLTERLVGLEYNQSCWTLRLVAEKFWYSADLSSTSIFIQLELNDLVAVGTDPLNELKMKIPGYLKLNDPKLNKMNISPTNTSAPVLP
jgi:LPS-assembly protein